MRDIGIDLGTSNVLIYAKDEGIVLNEPSIIAVDNDSKDVIAVGSEANKMLGRTPKNILAIRPIKDGVIADFEYAYRMLEFFLKKIDKRSSLKKATVIIGSPSNITQVERNAMNELIESIGVKKIVIEEEPKLAALGAGLNISEANGSMIVDIGGGTTNIAILSLDSIVQSKSIKIAGNSLNQSVIDYIKTQYDLLIGEKTAEEIKLKLSAVTNADPDNFTEIKGCSLKDGMPKSVNISEEDIKEAIEPQIKTISNEIKKTLENVSPELSSDIVEKGIILTGGGALIKGIVEYFEKDIQIPIYIAENPLSCVAEGCGVLLSKLKI